MKLEFLEHPGEGGHYREGTPSENVMRLFDFDQKEARQLIDLIESHIIRDGVSVDLSQIEFVKPLNCNLVLKIDMRDKGVIKDPENNFVCALTIRGFINMIGYIGPFSFAQNELEGYNWLCETSDQKIDLLFSPEGKW